MARTQPCTPPQQHIFDPKFYIAQTRDRETEAREMNLPLSDTEDEIYEDAREKPVAKGQEVQKPWGSKTYSPGSFKKTLVLFTLALLVLGLPLADANTRRCSECYRTVYQTKGNSFQIRHFFRAHTYVSPACYNITTLRKCLEKGHHYWMGKNLNTSKGQCPSDNWICFNFNHIRSNQDILKRKPIDIDLIQDVMVEEKQKQKEANPLNSHKNLFVDLAERISHQLNLTNCWVCGGTLTSETWPWQGVSIGPPDFLKITEVPPTTRHDDEIWQLGNSVVGEECIWRRGKRYQREVRETTCSQYLVTDGQKQWWLPKEPTAYWSPKRIKGKECIFQSNEDLFQCWEKGNPYTTAPHIAKYWTSASTTVSYFWEAPTDLFWICGAKAYSKLPSDWKGSCTLGAIQPSFFLLAEDAREYLGVPLYDELSRKKRHMIGGTQRWKNEEWPLERILSVYGPATWAQDGSWGYRTPIYMLNTIIRLQALIEIITNETAAAIDLLNSQSQQMRSAIYQNRLALDYLLAEEGGVCGNFNTSDCCLHIDNHGEAITSITQNIRKLAHVPVQRWQSITSSDWWSNLFPKQWWKKALLILGASLAGLIFFPCLIPCFIRLITSVVQSMPLIQDLQRQQLQQNPAGATVAPKIMQVTFPPSNKKNNKLARRLLEDFHKPETTIPEELTTFV